jgi:hypothetical protein
MPAQALVLCPVPPELENCHVVSEGAGGEVIPAHIQPTMPGRTLTTEQDDVSPPAPDSFVETRPGPLDSRSNSL